MAYNSNNETQEVIKEVDKNKRGDKIRVTKITKINSGAKYLDVRLFFTDDNDNIRPTSKGVRLSEDTAYDILEGMVEALGSEARQLILEKLSE